MFYPVPRKKIVTRIAVRAMPLMILAFSPLLLAACNSTPTQSPQPTVPAATATATGRAGTTGTATVSAPAGSTQEQPATTTAGVSTSVAQASPATAATPTVQATLVSGQSQGQGQAQGTETPVTSTEQPAAPEQNPVGDIPDNQAFVEYTSAAGGYTLQVPEGWARTENGNDVSFVDKLDGVKVSVTNAATAPTARTAPANEVAALQKAGRAVQVTSVKDVQLPGGSAVLVEYTSNSDPNPVTGKQVRLENNAYLFFNNGKLATLALWAPLGADNVDQWLQIAKSFKWK
jgi:hypothetical protein